VIDNTELEEGSGLVDSVEDTDADFASPAGDDGTDGDGTEGDGTDGDGTDSDGSDDGTDSDGTD
jgi:chitinase